jgi:hypothetical protein
MTTKKPAKPIDPTTEIDRPGIAELAGTSVNRVAQVCKIEKYGFPKGARKSVTGSLVYDLAAVKQWLENNDLKNIVFTTEDRLPICSVKQQLIQHDRLHHLFKSTTKAKRFKKTGKTQTVHLEATDEFIPAAAQLPIYRSNAGDHSLNM